MYRLRKWRGVREYKKEWFYNQNISNSHIMPLRVDYCGISISKSIFCQKQNRYNRLGIEAILSGRVDFHQHNLNWELGPGDVILKLPGKSHHYVPMKDNKLQKRYMGISGPMLPQLVEYAQLQDKASIKPSNQDQLLDYFHRAIQLMDKPNNDTLFKLSLLAYEFILFLARESESDTLPIALIKALDILSTRINKNWDYSALSKLVKESPHRLKSMFEEHIGIGLQQYLSRERINYAKQLLKKPDHSIKEISIAVGFQDPLYFSRRFHQLVGQSPTNYRQTFISQEEWKLP